MRVKVFTELINIFTSFDIFLFKNSSTNYIGVCSIRLAAFQGPKRHVNVWIVGGGGGGGRKQKLERVEGRGNKIPTNERGQVDKATFAMCLRHAIILRNTERCRIDVKNIQ